MGTKNLNSATDMITFTRASGGTALRKVSYGSELVTNSDFATNLTGWTDISINGGSVVQSSGVAVMTSVASGTGARMYQDVTTVVGKLYQLHVNRLSGFSIVQAPNFQSRNVSGVTTHAFVATSTTSRITLIVYNAGICQVDDVSVKEATLDQADGTLQLFNSPTNIPRIEYSADGTVKGLLIEEARTNLDTNSETFSGAVNGVTVTPNVATAPDGTQTATKLFVNSGATVMPRLVVYGGQDQPTNTSSIFAKAGEGSFNKIGLGAYNGAGYTAFAYFDLNTGTFDYIFKTSDRNIEDYGVESVGNGWYRVWIKPLNDSGTGMITVVSDDTVNSQISATAGNGVDGIYIWGHQVETGTFPTSYIPTTGVTATRALDVASIPDSFRIFNSNSGTFVVNFSYTDNGNTKANYVIGGSSSARVIYNNAGNNAWNIFDGATSTSIGAINGDGIAHNVAVSAREGSSTATCLDGTLTASASSSALMSNLIASPTISLGGASLSQKLNGHIKSIKYYPRRLSNTQLQELTT